jgi:outer membrane protein assembly factor BamB
VVATNSNAIGGGGITLAASLDAATGKTVQFNPKSFDVAGKRGTHGTASALYNAVYRDGMVYLMNSASMMSFNPRTGETKEVVNMAWNGRCARPIATQDKFILGHTAFLGRDFGGQMFSMARSGCAESPVPGSGLILFGPHLCSCVTHFDGYFATTSRAAPAPLPESARLVTRAGNAADPTPVASPDSEFPKSLIAEAWPWFTISTPVKPAAVEKAGWSFKIDPQAHRIDASNGAAKWTYIADARIGIDFAVVGQRVVVGTHDGWVHCLDLKTGAMQWRYLVAHAQRLIVANGMLTSAWPVFGVADLGNGQIVASAGTHAELDGGIRVVALKAEDGGLAWVKNLSKTPTIVPAPATGKRTQMREFSLINAAPKVESGRIIIDGGAHLNRLEFAPGDSEAQVNAALAVQKRI